MSVPQEVKDLINGSGNNFHAKVARWFQDEGWHITVSPYYMDQTQNKAREIDLIAEKAFPITGRFGDPTANSITLRLFVECKYVPSHSVFWFTDKDLTEAKKLVCSSGVFRENNSYTNKHHYLATSQKVAKLFSSNTQKGQELEPFYKALNQALNAFVSMRTKTLLLPSAQGGHGKTKVLDFPIVVCSSFDKLWSVDFYNESEAQKISDNFQLEVRYAYTDSRATNHDDYFLLDFVEFDKLSQFVTTITEDAHTAAFMLSSS